MACLLVSTVFIAGSIMIKADKVNIEPPAHVHLIGQPPVILRSRAHLNPPLHNKAVKWPFFIMGPKPHPSVKSLPLIYHTGSKAFQTHFREKGKPVRLGLELTLPNHDNRVFKVSVTDICHPTTRQQRGFALKPENWLLIHHHRWQSEGDRQKSFNPKSHQLSGHQGI